MVILFTMMINIGCSPKVTPFSGQQQTVIFTCPMHPEVIRDKPGSCPKCGMDLVKSDAKGGQNHKDCKMKSGGGSGCCGKM